MTNEQRLYTSFLLDPDPLFNYIGETLEMADEEYVDLYTEKKDPPPPPSLGSRIRAGFEKIISGIRNWITRLKAKNVKSVKVKQKAKKQLDNKRKRLAEEYKKIPGARNNPEQLKKILIAVTAITASAAIGLGAHNYIKNKNPNMSQNSQTSQSEQTSGSKTNPPPKQDTADTKSTNSGPTIDIDPNVALSELARFSTEAKDAFNEMTGYYNKMQSLKGKGKEAVYNKVREPAMTGVKQITSGKNQKAIECARYVDQIAAKVQAEIAKEMKEYAQIINEVIPHVNELDKRITNDTYNSPKTPYNKRFDNEKKKVVDESYEDLEFWDEKTFLS